jgi:hypothetical protein
MPADVANAASMITQSLSLFDAIKTKYPVAKLSSDLLGGKKS